MTTRIARGLAALPAEQRAGYDMDCQPIPGEVDVLQVALAGREEIPVFLSVTESQILCIAYLWSEAEVREAERSKMIEAMLEMNLPMPLSSFSRIGDWYVVFGALSVHAGMEEIAHEIVVLSDNAIDAIDAMADYLN